MPRPTVRHHIKNGIREPYLFFGSTSANGTEMLKAVADQITTTPAQVNSLRGENRTEVVPGPKLSQSDLDVALAKAKTSLGLTG